ncbi:MAG: Ankyrin repeat and death domain-containing protein 1A [Trichoglossum hirsutum]|nr:MAG: Ankyrin repeat and death domain-containing protein 1A [Trichoglossum hirsutum]
MSHPDIRRNFRRWTSGGRRLPAIHQGAREGLELPVRQALEEGSNVNVGDMKDGRTPLSWAAGEGHEAAVKLLLGSGTADVNSRSNSDRTPLSWAALNGHAAIVQLLLEQEAEVDTHDIEKRTPLSFSAGSGHQEVAELLLKSGTNVDSRSTTGITPLMYATAGGHKSVAELLLEKGANVNSADIDGLTPLSWAARHRHKDMAELLLEKGADVNFADIGGLTPLSWAARHRHKDMAELLLDKGANISPRSKSGRTPLSWAAESGDETIVQLLLEFGAQVSLEEKNLNAEDDSRGPEPGQEPTWKNWGTGEADDHRRTPLHYAARSGNAEAVVLLLTAGFSEDGEDDEHKTAMNYALEGGKDEVVQVIQEKRQLVHLLTPVGLRVGRLFNATVVEFFDAGKRKLHTLTVTDILEGKWGREEESGMLEFQWLHLPENNMEWIEILMAQHFRDLGWPGRQNLILRRELWAAQQHQHSTGVHHARFMRPHFQEFATGPLPTSETGKVHLNRSGNIVLFMPYIHWGTKKGLLDLKRFIKNESAVKKQTSEEQQVEGILGVKNPMEELIRAYLGVKHPLHIRRTLDQYHYYTLQDTDNRDNDQVPSRYFRKNKLDDMEVLMVDQLWLWVLVDLDSRPYMVISSFPQRKNEAHEFRDATDVLENVLTNVISTRSQVKTAYDLAELITSECSRVCFDTTQPRVEKLQLLKIYENSIGDVTNKEIERFDDFVSASMIKLSSQSRDSGSNLTYLDIQEEIKLLQEIKDIRDELNIMRILFKDQEKVLVDMKDVIQAMKEVIELGERQGNRKSSSEEHRRTSIALVTVQRHIYHVEELDKDAKRTYKALNHLLDLKQKEANVLEARSARCLAEETQKQVEATFQVVVSYTTAAI